ncbi:MAG: mismatch-specific DNA-glycosylase [Firmicutes bacterium]|nr:mismatch-specific DNA-glycosylase [Bacillota bacterium]
MNGLPDYLDYNLKILFIGYNPGLRSAELGHHYAGRSNSFFPFLYKSGLIDQALSFKDDHRLLPLYRYGLTNLVARPTLGIKELSRQDYREGAAILREKLRRYRPMIAAYVGIGVYKNFSGHPQVRHGLQASSVVNGVIDFVLPSTSGLNRLPHQEKLNWFYALRKLLDEEEGKRKT